MIWDVSDTDRQGGAQPKDRTPRLGERMQVFLVGIDVD